MAFLHQTVFHVLQIKKCTLQISCYPPPCLSVRFMLHALLSGLIKHHVQALFYPLKTMSCFGATLPLPSSPPFPLGPPPLPSSFSDSSPKACRDMKPLVFKGDNNNSKVILIIDSYLEHGPIFKC